MLDPLAGILAGEALEEVGEGLGLDRFGEVITGTGLDCFDGGGDAALAGHDDDDSGLGEARVGEEVEGIAIGEMDIEEGEIEGLAGEEVAGFGEGSGGPCFGSLIFKETAESFAEEGFVVEDED